MDSRLTSVLRAEGDGQQALTVVSLGATGAGTQTVRCSGPAIHCIGGANPTASFFHADHCNLDTAVLRATLFCAVVGDRLGFARTADLKLLGSAPRLIR